LIVTGDSVVQWVAERTGEHGNYGAAVGIGWEEGGKLRAGVVYSDFNGVNLCMHVASDGTKRWLRREYLRACFDYPFNVAGVRRVTGLVGEGNAEARKFDEHLGFKLETVLWGAHPTGNMMVYVMWRDMCRWLEDKHA
jgi:RimJ/RimL family protein N-acetyltransferase